MLSTTKTCEWCGKEFIVTRNKNQRFCSISCGHTRYTKEEKKRVCETCGKEFYINCPQRGAKYCSKKCAGKEKRPVVQLDLDMNQIETFDSQAQAALAVYGDAQFISRACRKHIKAYGYYWRHKDEIITQ